MKRTGKIIRGIGLTLFALYLGTLAWASLNPDPIDGQGPIKRFVAWVLSNTQQNKSLQWLDYNTLEGLANVTLYIPLGLGLALILRRLKWWADLSIGIATTVAVELTQKYLLPHRFSTFQDVLNNSLGVAIGVALGFIYVRSTAALRSRRNAQG